ncbi:Hypothetical predicted protein [Xyrichtys novacula]|uniref:Uncharacterized protein n=1 Tax=Xyrichtys novacula TaxID=13765 RepID=A0AAV1EIB8_XYRNO|nr:Hypothetical predicted protein [Xyrichtys novacula]
MELFADKVASEGTSSPDAARATDLSATPCHKKRGAQSLTKGSPPEFNIEYEGANGIHTSTGLWDPSVITLGTLVTPFNSEPATTADPDTPCITLVTTTISETRITLVTIVPPHRGI